MRPLGISLFSLFLFSSGVYAQNKQLLYDFLEIPQALMLNPGMITNYEWHAGIPMLSGISGQGGTSGLTVNDIFANDGIDVNQKVRDRAVFGQTFRDDVTGTYQVEVFSGGFRGKNKPQNYYSFGLYHEGYVINYWPGDLAILAYEGNANRIGRRFDLSHLKTRGQILNVFHFGINRQINPKWVLGGRAKLYSGILDFNSTNNRGYFVTSRGADNLLSNTLVADMQLRTSGLEAIRVALDDDSGNGISDVTGVFAKRGLFGGDLGVGLDLGFTYNLNRQTLITGSILDLGLMFHTTDARNFTLDGSATIEGVELILPDALADPDADLWQQLVDDIEALIPFRENDRSYVTFRPVQLYASIRHNWEVPDQKARDCGCNYIEDDSERNFYYINSAGGQVHIINRPRGPQPSLTGFYQRRFGNTLALKGTYTVDRYTWTNLGLGISLQAGMFNFYLIGDNLLGYSNVPASHYASFQLGFNIISWGRN